MRSLIFLMSFVAATQANAFWAEQSPDSNEFISPYMPAPCVLDIDDPNYGSSPRSIILSQYEPDLSVCMSRFENDILNEFRSVCNYLEKYPSSSPRQVNGIVRIIDYVPGRYLEQKAEISIQCSDLQ